MSERAEIKKNGISKHATGHIFPYYTKGVIIKGFGRGSKELGIPTANLCNEAVSSLPENFDPGVYYGWAKLFNNPHVYKMVMSVGWNPFYKNKMKSMEVHILHKFDEDFYELELNIVVLGYMRPEMDFNSLDDLITAIKNDIQTASDILDTPASQEYLTSSYFTQKKES